MPHRRTLACALTPLVLSGAAVAAPPLTELWVGGWFSDNVARIDWQTGAFIDMFIPANSGGLVEAHDFSFGPDGAFYVTSHGTNSVQRYDPHDGTFMDLFVVPGHNLSRSHSALWTDRDTLLVASELTHRVNEYDATGSFIRTFVAPNEAGLIGPEFIVEGPDGLLYLSAQSNQILRLDPVAGGVLDVFVEDDPLIPGDQTGGLQWAHGMAFGADGNLYVCSSNTNAVLRYDAATGDFIDAFVPPDAGGLRFPIGLQFGPDGHLYVASFGNSRILRYHGTTGAFLNTVVNLGPLGVSGPLGIHFFPGPKCAGDLTGIPHDVDFNDLVVLLGCWGSADDAPCARADLDTTPPSDGVIDIGDLAILLADWGPCAAR